MAILSRGAVFARGRHGPWCIAWLPGSGSSVAAAGDEAAAVAAVANAAVAFKAVRREIEVSSLGMV